MATALPSRGRPATLAFALAAALPFAHAAPALQREGRAWVIEARGLTRAALAHELAVATGSTLHGSFGDPAARVTLRWRGTSVSEAWDQVLGGVVSHARRCSAARCEVWLAGPIGAPVAPRTAAPQPAPLALDPPGLFPSE